ncbi:hypothetical protein [Lysobacter gummosus]|uniref:hypothetical protein n=1 Tax=Lysobacter gummosus TaxID=262324 RepID=UPI00363B2095
MHESRGDAAGFALAFRRRVESIEFVPASSRGTLPRCRMRCARVGDGYARALIAFRYRAFSAGFSKRAGAMRGRVDPDLRARRDGADRLCEHERTARRGQARTRPRRGSMLVGRGVGGRSRL